MKPVTYNALIASDWSECLSPNGPFDPLVFHFPHLGGEMAEIFRTYTGNRMTLSQATRRILDLLPRPLGPEEMDAYLEKAFETYKGVPDFIQWCLDRDICFMINTTGTQAYFQRAIHRGLLPRIPVLSASPMLRYPVERGYPLQILDLFEIEDKGRNTQATLINLGIPRSRLIIMGDSGGDGPHFACGAEMGAFLIGSMTKPSLEGYCRDRGIAIGTRFGVAYGPGQPRSLEEERRMDFRDLVPIVEEALGTVS